MERLSRILASSLAAMIASLLLSISARAGGFMDHVTFGTEWGYTASLYSNWHYNYFSREGFRIDRKGQRFTPQSNASCYGFVGVNIRNYSNIALYTGYAGIQYDVRVIPVGLRYTYYASGWRNDGVFIYMEPEVGFHISDAHQSVMAQVGAGYRFKLNRRMSLNLNGGIQIAADTPRIYDEENGDYVQEENVRISTASYASLVFNVSINF